MSSLYDPRPFPFDDDTRTIAHYRRLPKAIAGPGNDVTVRRGEVLIVQDGDNYDTVTLCNGGTLCADGGHTPRLDSRPPPCVFLGGGRELVGPM